MPVSLTVYIFKTSEPICVIFEWEIVYALPNDVLMTLDNHSIPKATTVSTFCVAFRIFIVDKCRNIEVGRQVDYINSQPTEDKPSRSSTSGSLGA